MASTSAQRIKRLIFKLNEALTQHEGKVSQRDLCQLMGITIGTMTKYMRGEVDPRDIRTRITFNLSKVLKITPEALYNYFETGKQTTTISVDQVQSWIRSECGQEDLPLILESLAFSQKKVASGERKVEEPKNMPVKGIKKEGVKIITKSFEKIFTEECKKRKMNNIEAMAELTPTIQEVFKPTFWGNVMNIISQNTWTKMTEEQMIAAYNEHNFECPMVKLLESFTNKEQDDLRDTCTASLMFR